MTKPKPIETQDSLARADPLVGKLVEVFNARHELDGSIDSLREWFNHRQPGDDFGIRLLGCLLWASELQTKLIQAQILAKGKESKK